MPPIEKMIGFMLSQVCQAHRILNDLALRRLNLHAGQAMILLQLWRQQGVTQSQVAGCLGVEPPTVTKMLPGREQEQLLTR